MELEMGKVMDEKKWWKEIEEKSPTHYCKVEYPPKEFGLGMKPIILCAEKVKSGIGEEELIENIPKETISDELIFKLALLEQQIKTVEADLEEKRKLKIVLEEKISEFLIEEK